MQPRRMRRVPARLETTHERLDGRPTRVGPKAQHAPFPECLRGHLRFVVAEEQAELAHGPRGHARAKEDVLVGRSGRRLGRVLGDPAEDRVDEAALPRRGEVHRLGHRRVARDPHEEQLVRAEPERGAGSGAHAPHRPRRAEPDRSIQAGDVSQRPERELRRERPIAGVQARTLEERGQHARGVGVLVGDPTHRLDRDRPRRGHGPNRSPIRSRTPRAQSDAGMRRRPGAATSSSRTAPEARCDHHAPPIDVHDRSRRCRRRTGLLGAEQLEVAVPETGRGPRLGSEGSDAPKQCIGRPRPVEDAVGGAELRCERRGTTLRGLGAHGRPRARERPRRSGRLRPPPGGRRGTRHRRRPRLPVRRGVAGSLGARLAGVGAEMAAQLLPELAAGRVTSSTQEGVATFAPKLGAVDRVIDWSQPADELLATCPCIRTRTPARPRGSGETASRSSEPPRPDRRTARPGRSSASITRASSSRRAPGRSSCSRPRGSREAPDAGHRLGAGRARSGRRTARMTTTARSVAVETVRRVTDEDAYSTRVLPALLERSRLAPRNRALATELALGTLRHIPGLDRAIGQRASRSVARMSPGARAALRLGAYQLLFHADPATRRGVRIGRSRYPSRAWLRERDPSARSPTIRPDRRRVPRTKTSPSAPACPRGRSVSSAAYSATTRRRSPRRPSANAVS